MYLSNEKNIIHLFFTVCYGKNPNKDLHVQVNFFYTIFCSDESNFNIHKIMQTYQYSPELDLWSGHALFAMFLFFLK